jgi:thiamine biosynthesis protein ThiI
MLLLTLSSEIHIKSSRTRRRFLRTLEENLRARLAREAPGARLSRSWDRFFVTGEDLQAAAAAASRTFGIHRVEKVARLPSGNLEQLAEAAAERARPWVEGKSFAVRVRRRGRHPWSSMEAERVVGALLRPHAAGVDLTAPDVLVKIYAHEDGAYLVEEVWEGPDGLPLGVQGKALALLSGGFDSAVAAWMIMRRGCGLDFVHFRLDCAQSEHALAVAHLLHQTWGQGYPAVMHVLEFQPVKDALKERVDPRLRQVVLKQLMVAAADRLARLLGIPVLVTGDSVGQVSSQTLEHLAAMDRFATRTVLRPLAGLTKDEIIQWARRVGTHDLSARAKEVCDLSEGPVAVAARPRELEEAMAELPEEVPRNLLAEWRSIALEAWAPGDPLVPVVPRAPEGVPLVHARREERPKDGPLALWGRSAHVEASRLHAEGREVWVVEPRLEEKEEGDRPLGQSPSEPDETGLYSM